MHIKWDIIESFQPTGWSLCRYPDTSYISARRYTTDRIPQDDVGRRTDRCDVALLIGICSNSIRRDFSQQDMPLTKNMVEFIRHALRGHFGSTVDRLQESTIQDVAKDMNRNVQPGAQPL